MTALTDPLTLYHNQRCSKSRGVQDILLERGVEFAVVNYLDNPPTAAKLLELCTKGGFPATDLVRFGESLARDMGISLSTPHDSLQWCELLAENPSLIERPIIETTYNAIIGRPPQRVLELLA